MYECKQVHIFMYVGRNVYIHACTYTYYKHACTNRCMYLYMYVHKYTYYIHMHMCMLAYIHTWIQTLMYMYT